MAKIVVERVYSIRLKHKLKRYPRWLRAKKAMRYLRKFLSRHMKTEPEKIKLDPSINLKIWERGAQKPPAKIRIRAVKFDDGVVEAELYTGEVKAKAEAKAETEAKAEVKVKAEGEVEAKGEGKAEG
jgi:large subunit ribosomal protein L31e